MLIALQTKAVELARERFIPFVKFMRPNFCEGRHHHAIAERLEALEAGQIKRLMVFMPPRSGKSFLVSENFPAWYIGRNPRKQILSVAYEKSLAEGWGRTVRNLVRSEEFQQVFPETEISPDSRASMRWHTTRGGIYHAAGITSGIAGKGASLAVIDDPLNEQDAFSATAKANVIRWYPAGLRSRLMPGGSIAITNTRWAEDDLTGWLLMEAATDTSKDQWEVLSIPALLDADGARLLGYREGTTYWPPHPNPPEGAELTGWSTAELLQTKNTYPPYQWEALYMQRPTAEGGNIIKRDYWQPWPGQRPPDCSYVLMSCDTAFSEKDKADYSAITTWGVFTPAEDEANHLILLAAEKERWAFPDLRARVLALYEEHQPDCILIEKKASGQSLIQELRRLGLPVYEYQPDKDKETRAHATTPTFYNERVHYPQGKRWAEAVIEECAAFPNAKHDDYVDTVTQAVLWVRDNLLVVNTDEPWDDEDETPRPRKRRFYWP